MGSRTLVMANEPQSSKELGFINEYNYVEINRNNWKEKLKYYLENESERERIAKNGYEAAIKHHSTDIRAKQLISYLKRADKQMDN
jgi:spore maturation protein CgeB